MTSEELEKYKLAIVKCCGCDKELNIAVPFKGNPLCGNCSKENNEKQ